jgi:clan AA aspartic protease
MDSTSPCGKQDSTCCASKAATITCDIRIPLARRASVQSFGVEVAISVAVTRAYWYRLGTMGLTKVTTKLTSFGDPKKSFESLFLVETEATDSMAPSDELDKIGIRQEGKMAYELADGTIREFFFGLVRIEFMGETTAGRVIFAAPGTEPLLGVTALESVGILVDPANKTLKRLPAIPLK